MNINKKNIIIIILVVLAAYLNCLGNGFVWDDIFTVVNNDFIRGPKLIKEVFTKPLFYFANAGYLYYRPFQSLTNMFDYSLWGLNPFGFHLSNVILNIIAAILIYYFVNLLFVNKELSFFTSLLFIVHPVNTSVVNYITSRADILLAIFTISSLILFIKANNYKRYLLSLICFILALLSKETAIIFPIFLIFTKEMYIKIKKENTTVAMVNARSWYPVFIIIPIAYILLRSKLLGIRTDIISPHYKVDFLASVFTLFRAIADYLKLIFLQTDFHMLRTIDIVQVTKETLIFYTAIIVFVMAGAFILYKLNKIIFFSFGMFFIWVMPVGSIALRNPEYYFQHKAIIEEHWLYIPAIGIFIIISWLIVKLGKYSGKLFYRVLFLVLIVYLSAVTFKENKFWKNNYTIFSRTLEFVDNSSTVYRNMGWICLNKKENSKAIDMYSKALALKQDNNIKMILYKDIAYAYLSDNQAAKAAEAIHQSLKIKHDYADARGYLGLIYSKDDLPRAKEEWKTALDMDGFNVASFNNLLDLSRSDSGIRDYLIKKYEAIPRQGCFEDYKIYRALGIVCLYSGMYPSALENLLKAIKIDPYDVKINNALAVYYAQTKDFASALRFFKRSLKLNPFDKEVYVNLVLLYNQLNQEDQARRLIEKSQSMDVFN